MKKEFVNEIISIIFALTLVIVSIPVWIVAEDSMVQSQEVYDNYLEIVKNM